MATAPVGGTGGTGGIGGLSPQSQAQVADYIQKVRIQSALDTQKLIQDSQAQLDAMTGGVGKMTPNGPQMTPTQGPGAGTNPLDPTGGLGTGTNPLDPTRTGGLGTGLGTTPNLTALPGGLGATGGLPGLGLGIGDPTGLGAGNLATPLGGLLGAA